ncbi:hypothetical protein C8R42DRAFT_658031 [Lentinula raphanica]|nr:hypothetical protein C8R42DRAFT_658031 [Lentinula raphanica]
MRQRSFLLRLLGMRKGSLGDQVAQISSLHYPAECSTVKAAKMLSKLNHAEGCKRGIGLKSQTLRSSDFLEPSKS